MFKKTNQTKDQLVADTSGLMDGRIGTILNLGFLNYEVLIPKFVVLELQTVADKSDKIRRDRARDALTLAGELIKSGQAKLFEQNLTKPDEVDNMLVELSRKLKAKLYTTDANLQRVAEIQSVKVLNPNELIHAIKLNFVPGENLKLKLSDKGSEKNQAIGYVNGVMVVVKDAESRIGQTIDVRITNLIESENGHIVFAEPLKLSGENGGRLHQPGKKMPPRLQNRTNFKPKPEAKYEHKPGLESGIKSNSKPTNNRPARGPRATNPNSRPKRNYAKRETPEDKMLASIEKFGD